MKSSLSNWCHLCICFLIGWVFTEWIAAYKPACTEKTDANERFRRTVNLDPGLTCSEDQYWGPSTDWASIKPPRGAPGNLFANLGGPFTRRAEVSGFLSLNSFLTPYPYTARIHPGHTVSVPTHSAHRFLHIRSSYLTPIINLYKSLLFWVWGEQGQPHSPIRGACATSTRGRCKTGRSPKTSSGGVGTMSTWGLVGLRSSLLSDTVRRWRVGTDISPIRGGCTTSISLTSPH